jgi:hypothetical protein
MPLSYHIYYSSVVLLANEKYGFSESDSILTIKMLDVSDIGIYKCIAKNRLGEAHASIELTLTQGE